MLVAYLLIGNVVEVRNVACRRRTDVFVSQVLIGNDSRPKYCKL